MKTAPSPMADVVISIDNDAWRRYMPAIRDHVQLAVIAALDTVNAAQSRGVEVSVMLTDDAAQRRLNRTYRRIDKATNVLAFPAGDDGHGGELTRPAEAPRLLGDVVLAVETVATEAARDGKNFSDHTTH